MTSHYIIQQLTRLNSNLSHRICYTSTAVASPYTSSYQGVYNYVTYYSYSCGFWGWSRCSGSTPRWVYRSLFLSLCLINPPIFSLPTAPAISQPTKLFTKPPTPRAPSVALAIVGLHQIAFVSHHTLMKHSCAVSSKEQKQLPLENNNDTLANCSLVSSKDSWPEYISVQLNCHVN